MTNQLINLWKKRIFTSIVIVLSLLFITCVSDSSSQIDIYGGLGKGNDPVPFLSTARRGTLPNGLQYYILRNSMPENRAFLTLAVNAGSILEQDHQLGFAHFVEHMAFRGTTRFQDGALLDYLRSLGMRFGPDVNAYTTYDRTVYGIEVPVEIGENGVKRIPSRALEVIDDWTWGVTFNQKDVDDERLVVLEEHRMRLGANERIREQTLPLLLEGSPYWERSPIGTPETLQSANPRNLRDFYTSWYRADNMALIFVGDFDDEALERELAAHFQAPAPTTRLNRPVYELPNPKKGSFKIETITDPEYLYSRVDMYYKGNPITQRGTLSAFRNEVMDILIDDIITLRFEAASLQPDCPYIGAGTWESRYGRSSIFYALSVISKPGMLQESLRAVLREKESIARYGFTTAEIERAKNALISNVQRQVSEKDHQNTRRYVSDFTDHFLEDLDCADIEWYFNGILAMLPGITQRDLANRAAGYFSTDDLTVFQIAPESERENLMSHAEIQRLIAVNRRETIPRPQEEALVTELLAQEPLPGSIIREYRDNETGVIRWELSNGAQVILKETRNRNNEIIFRAVARGGTTSSPEAENVSANLAEEMLEVSGVGPYNRTELMQFLSGKQASLSFSSSYFYRAFNGNATVGDLKTLFELLYLYFTQPRIDDDAVAVLIDQYQTTLSQRKENPEYVFYDEITKLMYGNNPRFNPLELEDLERINPREAFEFIQRAMNPADYTFVFTGNLDIPQIRAYTETYLASIPRKTQWNTWDAVRIIPSASPNIRIYKGKEEQCYVFLGWFRDEPYAEHTGIGAEVLTEYLDIILTQEIREKLGGVYYIGASSNLSPLPAPGGSLSLYSMFVCDPHRATELIAAVRAQIELIAQGRINRDTFAVAVEAMKRSFEESIQSNRFIARNYADLEVLYRLPLSRLEKRPELYDQVTIADLQNICRRLLAQSGISLIVYPEGWTD